MDQGDPLMITMLAQVVPEAEIVEVVVLPDRHIPGFPSGPCPAPGLENASSRIRGRVAHGFLINVALTPFLS